MNILDGSITSTVFIFAVVIISGLLLGNIKFFTINLGIAGVLFTGLLFGHFKIPVSHEILEFVREFGLILFVYTIGLQVGPGFFDSLRSKGLVFNLLAAGIVILGALITIGLHFGAGLDMSVAVGLFSGATTNTPSLGAAQQVLKDIFGTTSEVAKLPGLGYAVAYPFGILGIIITMLLVRFFFKINPAEEANKFYEENKRTYSSELKTVNLLVKNPNLEGIKIKDIPSLTELGIVISRLKHKETVCLADLESTLHLDDIIYGVGEEDKIKEFQCIIGEVSETNLLEIASNLTYKEIIVTKEALVGKTLDDLKLRKLYGVTITRVSRGDQEFTANTNINLHYGDILRVVGDSAAIQKVEKILGNSTEALEHPRILFIFLGIGLGVFLGSLPITIPGLSVPVKLGMAGGPLITAILISRLPVFGSLVSYFPFSANLALRELGITLFLACVGLKSGDKFVDTLIHGDGFLWMALASLITLIPLIIIGFIARKIFKINYMSVCGLLSGSMTDPPALAFANSIAASNAPSIAYATVYPLVMLLRIVFAQLLVLIFCHK